MGWQSLRLLIFVFMGFAQASPQRFAAQPKEDFIVGTWWTQNRDAKVRIFREDDRYFGKIEWSKGDPDERGRPQLDVLNPDPKLRIQAILGSVFIRNLKAAEDASAWEGGEVYDSDNGKTYRFKIARLPDREDAIKIRGYIGIPLLGGSEVWTRAR